MTEQQRADHERIRRELWAAIYRQEHEHKTFWVDGENRADQALRAFDKRFGTDGVAPSQTPSWWQVSYDHGKTWHDRATWPDPNKEVGLAMARIRHVSGVPASHADTFPR